MQEPARKRRHIVRLRDHVRGTQQGQCTQEAIVIDNGDADDSGHSVVAQMKAGDPAVLVPDLKHLKKHKAMRLSVQSLSDRPLGQHFPMQPYNDYVANELHFGCVTGAGEYSQEASAHSAQVTYNPAATYLCSAARTSSGYGGGDRKLHEMKVAGVTHNNRQATIAALRQGEAVMLVPEPENAYDRSAVAINLLDGTSLGFIRKEDQAEYSRARLYEKEHIRFGRVSAAGAFSPTPYKQLFYARVKVDLYQRFLHAIAVPPSLRSGMAAAERPILERRSELLSQPPDDLEGRRCCISGAGEPLTVAPIWVEDTQEKSMILKGWSWMATSLADAQTKLLGQRDAAAEFAFQRTNQWTPEELKLYREHQIALQARRERQQWSITVESIEQMLLPPPFL